MSTISPDVIASINENLYEVSGAWLWSTEDVYSQDYLEVYGTGPISLEAVTLAQVRWKADQTDIIVRSGPAPTSPVVFACTAMLLQDREEEGGVVIPFHADLRGLLGNGPDFAHPSVLELSGLTGGASTTLHYHAADRSRANHTGTQLAATISDFGAAAIAATAGVYQPISAELSALAGLSSTGYAKRTGAGAWSVVTAIPQADVSGLTAALAGLQPLDSDLTAIAALTTTNFGRSLLTVADAAAARTAIGAQAAGSYQASSSVLTSIAAQSSGTGLLKLTAGVASLDSSVYALASSVPVASSTTPASLGTAAVGIGTTWARADHVHAKPTAVQVGAEPALGNPGTSGYVLASTIGGVRSWVALPSVPVSSVFGRTGAVVAASGDYSAYYLGVSAQAADSAKLNGQPASYYATAAILGNYLPLSAGSGAALTGGLFFSGSASSSINFANGILAQAPSAGAGFVESAAGDIILRANSSGTVRIGSFNGSTGPNVSLSVGLSSITMAQPLTGTTATFGNAALGTTTGQTSAWFGYSGLNNGTGTPNGYNQWSDGGLVMGFPSTKTAFFHCAGAPVLSMSGSAVTASVAITGTTATMGVAAMGASAYDSNMAWFGRAGYNSTSFGKGFLTNGQSAWVCALPGNAVNLRVGNINVVNCQAVAVNINVKLWGQDASFGSTVDAITSVKGGAAKIGTSNVLSGWAWMGMNAVNEGNYGVHTDGNSLVLIANSNNSMYLYSGGTAMVTISSTGVDLPYLKTLKFSAIVTIGSGTALPVVAPGEVVMLVGASTGSVTNNPVTNASQNCKYRTSSGAQASAAAGGATVNLDLYGNVAFLVGRTTGSATLLS